MAYRKTNKSSIKFNPREYIPLWSKDQTETVNLAFMLLMNKVGVSDVHSYFHRLPIPIVICALVGAVYGAYTNGFWGFVWGSLAGIAAPAALLWLGIVVFYCAVILGVFFAAWAAIIFGFFWLIGR